MSFLIQVLNDDNFLNGKVDVHENKGIVDGGIHSISDVKTTTGDEKESHNNKNAQLDELLRHIYDKFVNKADDGDSHRAGKFNVYDTIRYDTIRYDTIRYDRRRNSRESMNSHKLLHFAHINWVNGLIVKYFITNSNILADHQNSTLTFKIYVSSHKICESQPLEVTWSEFSRDSFSFTREQKPAFKAEVTEIVQCTRVS